MQKVDVGARGGVARRRGSRPVLAEACSKRGLQVSTRARGEGGDGFVGKAWVGKGAWQSPWMEPFANTGFKGAYREEAVETRSMDTNEHGYLTEICR